VPRRSVSLAGLLLASAALCLAVIAAAALSFWRSSERAAVVASERSRQRVARGVEARVAAALGGAAGVLDDVERAFASGLVSSDDRGALEALLYTELLGSVRLAEVSFTAARPLQGGLSEPVPGESEPLAADGRYQVSVFWSADGRLSTQLTERDDTGYVERRWYREPDDRSFRRDGAPQLRPGSDPTLHPTFVASIAREQEGRPVWSDLHFSELDRGSLMPRVVLSVQKAVRTRDGVGVIRVGLLTTALDAITEHAVEGANADDPHRVALLAVPAAPGAPARLVTRVAPDDELCSLDDELRVVPRAPGPAIGALLNSPLLHGLDAEWPQREGELEVSGEPWLATLSPLSIAGGGTRGWLVAVLVPKSHYTRELAALGQALAVPFALSCFGLLAVLGGVVIISRTGLGALAQRTARMRDFDFRPDASRSVLTDIAELLDGLERAKTVARAMGKYIPVALVRSLYEKNREPELGGESLEVTLMFSDIQGFTSLAEGLDADRLARHLGQYLEVMTRVIERHGGTIDKYIGDAVMAFWNAPSALDEHAVWACRAVLACQQELAELYASPAWGGLPPLVTRFGLHRDRVLVGHFGAPSRLSYTALGDGVNLASRLESACKQYGVTVLASDAVREHAMRDFEFRAVDRVTVRGKTRPVDVYELTGPRPAAETPRIGE
jgi:adenylate cyclase